MEYRQLTKLLIISIFLASVDGLTRLFEETGYCLDNKALFTCVNDNGPVILWELGKGSNQVHFNWNANFDRVGEVQHDTMLNSALKSELVSGNSSFVVSSLTIAAPHDLTSYVINCNEEVLILNISNSDTSRPPLEVSLYQLKLKDNMWNFSATWDPAMSDGRDQFFVSVSPNPPCGPTSWITGGSSTTLNLRNDTIYSMAISTCPYMTASSNFNIGTCPFLLDLDPEGNYLLSANGTVFLQCSQGNNETFSECGLNGEWYNIARTCIREKEEPLKDIATSSAESVSSKSSEASKLQISEPCITAHSSLCMPLTVSISCVAVITAAIIIIASFVLGFRCGSNSAKRRLSLRTGVRVKPEAPLYEEIEHFERLQVLENVAYAEVQKLQ